MNINSTEIKNEMGGTVGQGGTGDSPVAAGNLPGASDQSKIANQNSKIPPPVSESPSLKVSEPPFPDPPLPVSPSPSLKVSTSPILPVFIKTPQVFSRQGELLTPEHPDYPVLFEIVTRELSERFQNGDFT